jgi:hypothetical protein
MRQALEASIERLDVLLQIFAFIVAVGVLGEAIFGVRHVLLSRRLRSLTNAEEKNRQAEIVKLTAETEEARALAKGFESQIASANERAAGLEVEALRLQEKLASQGPRANLLRGENRSRLVDVLKPFSGQKIDVRRSAWVFEVNGAVVSSTPLGEDTIGLSEALIGVLKEAGWQLPPEPLLATWQGYGLNVWFRQGASAETQSAAKCLVQALTKIPLTVSGPSAVPENLTTRVGTASVVPPLTGDTIILIVLTHP